LCHGVGAVTAAAGATIFSCEPTVQPLYQRASVCGETDTQGTKDVTVGVLRSTLRCASATTGEAGGRAITLSVIAEQGYVDAVVQALAAGKQDEPWPEHLLLRDALDELTRWLGDDHQWGARGSGPHWLSLIGDLRDAIGDLGPAARSSLDVEPAVAALEQAAAEFDSKQQVKDQALRERLTNYATLLTERIERPAMPLGAWEDLLACVQDRDAAPAAARRFLSLAGWAGHDVNSYVREITRALDGESAMRIDGELVSPPTDTPLQERLDGARTAVRAEPARASLTVWLRFRLAQIRWPPVIPIGEEVRIYRGDWLRSCLCGPAAHHDLPVEATGQGADALRDFCGVEAAHVEAGGPPHDPHETPFAYIRVAVGEQLVSRAVDIARSNAEAIAALGAVYGEEPTIWRLDRSYCVFDGERNAGGSVEAEEPAWTESVGVAEDRTGQIVLEVSERLAGHVPFRDRELEEAMTMFGWLRGARSTPPAARLVLCDRVIEAVCGWAGMRSRHAFVRDHLIPWWARTRVEFLTRKVAHRLFLGPSARLHADDPFRAVWEEIRDHEPLGLRNHPPKVLTSTLVAEVPWLLARVPAENPLGQDLAELDRRTRTGAAALEYWQGWRARGQLIEARRLRSRNAIIHGGPLSRATVEQVVLFAEHLASEALIPSLDAKLAGKTIAGHFADRLARVAEMERRLRRDDPADPPGEILFPAPSDPIWAR
jgi:hypothetical protein